MKYIDGSSVVLGDRVNLGGGMTGVVVAVIDDGAYSSNYPADQWSYLSVGALVESLEGGLVHRLDAEHDFELIERAASDGGMN